MRQAIVEDCVARWRSRFFDIPLLVRYILLFPDLDLDRILFAIHNPQADAAWTRPTTRCRGLFKKKLPEAARIAKRGGERRTAGRDVTG